MSREHDKARLSAQQVAHELANLLDGSMRHVSLAMSRLRANDAVADDDLIEQLSTASRAMHQMAHVIRTWMRLENTSQIATPAGPATTLGTAAEEVIKLLTPAADAANVSLHIDLPHAVAALPASCVPTILLNTLRNSVDAIASSRQREGRIDITAALSDGRVTLTIRDDGPGIPRTLVDSDGVFQFGQTHTPGGHGVGLPLCRQLVESMRGSLTIESLSPGGTVVTIIYPQPHDVISGAPHADG